MYIQKSRKFKFKFYGADDDTNVLPVEEPAPILTYLPESASLEEKTLERNIFNYLTRMDVFYAESLEIEQKTLDFVEKYYASVGDYINTIIMLDEQIVSASFHKQLSSTEKNITQNLKHIFFKNTPVKTSSNKPNSNGSTPIVNESSLEIEARRLYHALVKLFHPDVMTHKNNVEENDIDIIHTINEAYSKNHIGSLWRITFEQDWKDAINLTNNERMELLNYYYDKITKAIYQVSEHRKQVTSSPEYDLYQKHLDAIRQGYNFIEQVEQDLSNEIIAKHRRISYLKATGRLVDS